MPLTAICKPYLRTARISPPARVYSRNATSLLSRSQVCIISVVIGPARIRHAIRHRAHRQQAAHAVQAPPGTLPLRPSPPPTRKTTIDRPRGFRPDHPAAGASRGRLATRKAPPRRRATSGSACTSPLRNVWWRACARSCVSHERQLCGRRATRISCVRAPQAV